MTTCLDVVACIAALVAGTFPQLVYVSESVYVALADEHVFAFPCPSQEDAAVIDEHEVRQSFAVAEAVIDVLGAVSEFCVEYLSAARIASFALSFSDAAAFVVEALVYVFEFYVTPTLG